MASKIISQKHQGTPFQCSLFAFPLVLSLGLFVLNASKPVGAVLTTCYDPSGDERPDKPCFPDAVSSFCCATGWVCTNTSLCVASSSVTLNPDDPTQFEGTCTDQTWNSPGCPSFCRSAELSKNEDNGVFYCGNGDYCCSAPEFGGSSSCCGNSSVTFFLGDYVNMTTIGGAVGPGEQTSTTSISSTASSVSASTTTSMTSSITSSTASSVPASTTTSMTSSTTSGNAAGQSSTQTSPTSSGAQTNTPSSGMSTGGKAGIAIGAVLGVGALATIAFLIYRQQKNTKLLKKQLDEMQNRSHQTREWVPHTEMEAFTPKVPIATERYELGQREPLAELLGTRR